MPATIDFLAIRSEPTGIRSGRFLLPVTTASKWWQQEMFPAAQAYGQLTTPSGPTIIQPIGWDHYQQLVPEIDIHSDQQRYLFLGTYEEKSVTICGCTFTDSEVELSIAVFSGSVIARSPFRYLFSYEGGNLWTCREIARPLQWRRRYILWGLWRRLTEPRHVFGLSGRAERLARGLHRLSDSLGREERENSERTTLELMRGRRPDMGHVAVARRAQREFEVKYRARIRLLVDDIRKAGVEVGDDVIPDHPVHSGQLAQVAATLQYYAAKAERNGG